MVFDLPVPRYGSVYFSVPGQGDLINRADFKLKGATASQLCSVMPVSSAPMTAETCPYYGFTRKVNDKDKAIKLSAYPYRAYESIYNGYMRNIRNNPFLIDGKPVYNRFIPVNTGGEDTHEYSLYSANWASDAFTTAVPSPQQGTQPLVGLTTYTEQVPQGSTTATVLKTALVDEDGNKYKVSYQSNGSALTGVTYEKLSDDTAVSPVSSLYNLLQSGISINDFRNVNAYQRYLEMNMFKGYSYRQIVEGRFDCTVHYDTLLLPEYLGGITRDVTINPVTQMIEVNGNGTYNGALGSQAGNGTCFGNSEHTIKGFCDEESIVMGLLTVVPMPVYTQPIPKFFLYRDRLDTFNPEFDHIGYQPIYTKELCPVNQWLEDKTKMNTVFGYQRPWYEYVQKRDTAHGLFRTELRNFIMNRVFSGVPELGQDFTTVDPAQVNDVFSVTDVSDKILGQVYFDCTVKLPISRVVVPRLE
nr:MAG: major capsid protein [Microvirus sp.]